MLLGYLDGNTGSLLATVMVGGTAGAVVAARSARARLSGAFGRKKGAEPPPESPDSVDAEAPTDAADAPTDAAAPADTAPAPGHQAASPAGPSEAAPGA